MNLYRKDIGVPFISEEISGVYPYQYSDIPLVDWFDITSIINNDSFGSYAADYVRATKEMAILFEAMEGSTEQEKWNNCTLDEKRALAKRMITDSQSLRLEVYTQSEDEYNFLTHADLSINCREYRIDACKIAIGYLLSVADRVDLFTDLFTMIETFINVNDTAIHTWMHSDTGFKAKTYYSIEIESIYIKIVEDGIINNTN